MLMRPGIRARCALWSALICLLAALIQLQGEELAPKGEARRIVVLGDSLAAGHGLEPEEAFPALLQKKIEARGWPFTVINAGVSGDTTAGGLRRMTWLLKQRIDILIIELGGNDGLRGIPVQETQKNLEAIARVTKSKYPHARLILAGMQMPPNLGEPYTRQFKAVYPEVARKTGAVLIPFLLEGVGGRPELNQPDHIHPTAEGQSIIAGNVWRGLEPVLKEILKARQPAWKDRAA